MIRVLAYNSVTAELPVEVKHFPGGEVHVTVKRAVPLADHLEIHAHLPNAVEVMVLLNVVDAVRRLYPGVPVDLVMPYVPYARQDRVANVGEALSAKVFCSLINAQGFRSVRIQDPHSDVVPALLDNVCIDSPLLSLRRTLSQTGDAALVAPDAGARKRVMMLGTELNRPVVFADKSRDTVTGKISGTRLVSELLDMPLLIVDDICDGGWTFTELAKALKAEQAARGFNQPIYLYVTHGIFSKGLDPLLPYFENIFTRNNWTSDTRCTLV